MSAAEEYKLNNYGKESTFASFLPGIAGLRGIPVWCYYVNRGQCVVSFGVDHKDHAIMEFYPAHQAYQNVKRTGFRTFIRKNGSYYECFADEDVPHAMRIKMNELSIEEINRAEAIKTTVDYCVLPGEKLGALLRKVSILNLADSSIALEVLDGMPSLIPYGVGQDSMKNMGQTAKAWMQVENLEKRVPYYRVRASMEDSAAVKEVRGGNFSFGCLRNGSLLKPIVDPEAVFGYDNSLGKAVVFKEEGLDGVERRTQNIVNLLPCSFYAVQKTLPPKGSLTIYEVIGQTEQKELLASFLSEPKSGGYFEAKRHEAAALAEEINGCIRTETANQKFDAYCRNSYLDNVLRGGYPVRLGNNKIFYAYSRKHGDLERDYNYFSMLPEFYSQGNGNYRDVSQNRRCDTFFSTFVERDNIKLFYNLIQLDGYNPLVIEKTTYQMEAPAGPLVFGDLPPEQRDRLACFTARPFTPGALYRELDGILEDEGVKEQLFIQIIDFAEATVNGSFGEGYWCDHWTYNLDLIENYLEVYPEREEDLLYEEAYTYFPPKVKVNPRSRRYEKTEKGIRQYHALERPDGVPQAEGISQPDAIIQPDGMPRPDSIYRIYKTTLMEKLILLCVIKYATLDAYGMGVEMEGGKPGWNDAMNGLPGMLGSSMAETYELARCLNYTIGVLSEKPASFEIRLTKELWEFISLLAAIDKEEKPLLLREQEVMGFWNRISDAREAYREKIYAGISGDKETVPVHELVSILKGFEETVRAGIRKAILKGNGICPTFFTYEVTDYSEDGEGIHPRHMQVGTMPHFLEGPVRYLKLDLGMREKKELYRKIKGSDLYDRKLSMYKLNGSLEAASYEIGRAKAFTPGWLENESIWLHMEYKYLLELLKSGLYEEFFGDFHKAAIPFLEERVYGRSTLENSSFLCSSKNPDVRIHGKGFVARLSGSTAEFLSIWKLMMFGERPFFLKKGELAFELKPAIPEYLITMDKTVKATLLGATPVTYRFGERRNYYPGNYEVASMEFIYRNGNILEVTGGTVTGRLAADIREKKIVSLTATVD